MKIWHIGLAGTIISFLSLIRSLVVYTMYSSNYDMWQQFNHVTGLATWVIGGSVFLLQFLMFFRSDR